MASTIKSQSEARAYLHDLKEALNFSVFEIMSSALGSSTPTLKAVGEAHEKAGALLDKFARAAEGVVRQRQAAKREGSSSKESTIQKGGRPSKKSQLPPSKNKKGTRAYAAWLAEASDSDGEPLEQPWSEFHI